MEENTTIFKDAPVGKNSLNFGLVAGAVLILFSLLVYVMELWAVNYVQYIGFLILIVVMFIGTKTYRDKFNNGLLSYGRGFTASFTIGIIAAVIVAVYTYVFYKFFDPSAIAKIIEIAEEGLLESSPELSDEQFDMAMSYTKKFMQPGWMTVWSFVGNVLASVVISLLLPLFLKKEEVITDTTV